MEKVSFLGAGACSGKANRRSISSGHSLGRSRQKQSSKHARIFRWGWMKEMFHAYQIYPFCNSRTVPLLRRTLRRQRRREGPGSAFSFERKNFICQSRADGVKIDKCHAFVSICLQFKKKGSFLWLFMIFFSFGTCLTWIIFQRYVK